MPQERFTLENLPQLDFGIVPEVFDREMKRVVKDCMDRPHDDKARAVNIKFAVKPLPSPSAQGMACDEVQVEVEVDSAVPKQRTKIYTMRTKADGGLVFHPDLPDDPDERTIMDEADERRGRKGGE